uniref:Uncharacterized protein n=1 Tax=Ditylenchus dipsaci TaxID=166011 RepID=A0A915CPA6_9BILA
MKDESLKYSGQLQQGVPVFKSFPPSRSVFRNFATKARNFLFLPLYLCGFSQMMLCQKHFRISSFRYRHPR